MIKQEESVVQHEKVVVVMKNDDIRTTSWADLPSDNLYMIFSFLFEFDHLSFRLTCKAWQSSVRNCRSISSSIKKIPWLMSYAKPQSQGVFSFFNPISNLTYVMKIPELAGAYFRCSRLGWLLMSRSPHSLFFYNPFIPGSIINIPDFNSLVFVTLSFTAPPTSPDCIVFANAWSPGETLTIRRWGYGEDKWTEYKVDCQEPFFSSSCTPFFYKDVFYHLDKYGRLGVLDPKKRSIDNIHQKFTWNDNPQPIAQKDNFIRCYTKNFVAECDGQWVLVFVSNRGDHIHVFEFDWSQMGWVTVQSLGNKAMFIGETGSLLIKTSGSGAENKIYFSRFVNTKGYGKSADARTGVFYCLETCKYHAFESKFSCGNWVGTRGVPKFAWIEPNFERDDCFRFLEDRIHSDHN